MAGFKSGSSANCATTPAHNAKIVVTRIESSVLDKFCERVDLL